MISVLGRLGQVSSSQEARISAPYLLGFFILGGHRIRISNQLSNFLLQAQIINYNFFSLNFLLLLLCLCFLKELLYRHV